MHLLIPFAYCGSDGCAAALPTLKLPQLQKLLSRLTPDPLDAGTDASLSPPHERALARLLGLPTQDGMIPWAAQQARQSGAWAFITPCHWQTGTHHIAMSGQELPDFSAQESQALLAAMRPYFEEDGIALHYDQPQRWLACGDIFNDLASASLDRVVGRNVEHWMPRSAHAAPLRRLQNEMQMLLYTHPVNDARSARRVLPVNSFWISGSGCLPPAPTVSAATQSPLVVPSLRAAALNENWADWVQAWVTLDATECTALLAELDRGHATELTLCGERSAQTWRARPQSFSQRFMNIFSTQTPSTMLEKL